MEEIKLCIICWSALTIKDIQYTPQPDLGVTNIRIEFTCSNSECDYTVYEYEEEPYRKAHYEM